MPAWLLYAGPALEIRPAALEIRPRLVYAGLGEIYSGLGHYIPAGTAEFRPEEI
jgi:hypothetical protein